MTIANLPPRTPQVAPSQSGAAVTSYVDWAAILAGTVFALAISFVLITFGAGLGLSLTSPYRGEGVSAAWIAIAAGIWFAWVMVTAFGAGGYLAGRMRSRVGDATADEVSVRDGTHGLMVWATGAVISMIVAASGIGGLIGAGTAAIGATTQTAAEATDEAVSSDYFANLLLRGSPDATAQEATSIDPAVQQEIGVIVTRSVVAGTMPERDRAYVAQLIAANTDLSVDEARARVEEINAEIDGVIATAVAAIDQARVAGVVFGFIAAATLLIGAVAAFFAAMAGGHHRDEGLGFDAVMARR
jgi:hypothetical protein